MAVKMEFSQATVDVGDLKLLGGVVELLEPLEDLPSGPILKAFVQEGIQERLTWLAETKKTGDNLEQILTGEGSAEQKAGSIWQIVCESVDPLRREADVLLYLDGAFVQKPPGTAERQVLVAFGNKLRRGADKKTTSQKIQTLFAAARPILNLDLLVQPQQGDTHYTAFLLKLIGDLGIRNNPEEQCNVLAVLSLFRLKYGFIDYLNARPGVTRVIKEYLQEVGGRLTDKPPLLTNLTAAQLRFYAAASDLGIATHAFSSGKNEMTLPYEIAVERLHQLKQAAERGEGMDHLDYLRLWGEALRGASPMTKKVIPNLMVGRYKEAFESIRKKYSPPSFLNDFLRRAIDAAKVGDTRARKVIAGIFDDDFKIPLLIDVANTEGFSVSDVGFIFKDGFEVNHGVIFELEDQYVFDVLMIPGAGLWFDTESEDDSVYVIYPEVGPKLAGRAYEKKVELQVVHDNNAQKEDETVVIVEVVTPEPQDPRVAATSQLAEFIGACGFDNKTDEEIMDETTENNAKISGPRAGRTKTLNPKGSVLKLDKSIRNSPRVEFTYNTDPKSQRGVALSDLQGALILGGDTRLPFLLAYDGILMDQNGENFFLSLAEQDLRTYLILNSLIISRACEALIDPPQVLINRANRIARKYNRATDEESWERRTSERVRANLLERVSIKQSGDMLSIERLSEDEEIKLEMTEIADILNSGEVNIVAQELLITPDEAFSRFGRKLRSGTRIIHRAGREVRRGGLRVLGKRHDGNAMLPSRAVLRHMKANHPENRLKIIEISSMDPESKSIGTDTFYTTFQSPVKR